MYRYLGRFIDTSGIIDNQYLSIVLIIDGIDTSPIAIVSMSQPITSMAPLAGDDDTIDVVSMADPWLYIVPVIRKE
jgi:hypothetical protein